MKVIAIIMALAVILFMFAPKVEIGRADIPSIGFEQAAAIPVCHVALPPKPLAKRLLEEFIIPKPDPDDGD